jgi:hypothetical protein
MQHAPKRPELFLEGLDLCFEEFFTSGPNPPWRSGWVYKHILLTSGSQSLKDPPPTLAKINLKELIKRWYKTHSF